MTNPTKLPILLLVLAMLFAACGGGAGLAGTYMAEGDGITLTLKADGTCIADHGGGTIIGGKYRVEDDKVLFQWDNGEGDGARIDGDALLAHGMRLVKQ